MRIMLIPSSALRRTHDWTPGYWGRLAEAYAYLMWLYPDEPLDRDARFIVWGVA